MPEGMEFLRKYCYGQLTPQEEVQVQGWLVEHADEPQVQDALLTIMSEMQSDDTAQSSRAYADVCRRLASNSFITDFNLSSNWPRYLVPASIAAKSSDTIFLSNRARGT